MKFDIFNCKNRHYNNVTYFIFMYLPICILTSLIIDNKTKLEIII